MTRAAHSTARGTVHTTVDLIPAATLPGRRMRR